MMLLSVVPGIGAALVWFPAVLYLAFNGQLLYAGSLFAFCGLLVGTIDNVLRPKLVGNDTQLHELMIFFSTIGGLLTFGFSGFIIGPIIAALFVTVWEIYGVEFKNWLPESGFGQPQRPDSKSVSTKNWSNTQNSETRSLGAEAESGTVDTPDLHSTGDTTTETIKSDNKQDQ